MRLRTNVYFPPEILRRLIDLSDRKRVSRSSIVEAAVASFLSPDRADRSEAAFTRRLDRLSRQVQRLERDVAIGTETLALFVHVWLTATPQLPANAQPGAEVKGRERYENFVQTLGRRLAEGRCCEKSRKRLYAPPMPRLNEQISCPMAISAPPKRRGPINLERWLSIQH